MNCFHILDINLLSVISFPNIFSHLVGCLFILLVSFAVQKLLSLIRSNFFIFVSFALGPDSPQNFYTLCQRVCCPCFLLVLWFPVLHGSLIHFEFIFVYGVRKCSNFILLHVADQFSQHHLLKRLSFLHCIFLYILALS